MVKDMHFCHFQIGLKINMAENQYMLQQKQELMLKKLLLKELAEDLTGNNIVDKITSVDKTKSKDKEDETNKTEEVYIPPEEQTTNSR